MSNEHNNTPPRMAPALLQNAPRKAPAASRINPNQAPVRRQLDFSEIVTKSKKLGNNTLNFN